MSYCRQPYYIYDDVSGKIMFDAYGFIPDKVINVFLYKLFLDFNREDLKERLKDGRKRVGKDVELHYKGNEDELLLNLLDIKTEQEDKYLKAYKNIDKNALKEMEENMEEIENE